MGTINNNHKTCHMCKKRVTFPLWYWQRAKKQMPTCEDCLVKMGLDWTPPRNPDL